MKIPLLGLVCVVLGGLLTMTATVYNNIPQSAYAAELCIFFCPEDNTKQLNAFIACMEGNYLDTEYGTEDLTSDGKKIPSKAQPGTMITEDELKKEWNEHSNLYVGDCYKDADITPQKVEAIYRESIGK